MNLIKAIHSATQLRSPQEIRRYIGASSIGKTCLRSIWYGFHGFVSDKIPPSLQITFDIGKSLEKLLMEYISISGIKVEEPNEKNNFLFCQDKDVPEMQGHMDAVLYLDDISSTILEIKTAKSSSFNKFKKDGLVEWSDSYNYQIQSYMGMSGIHDAIILVINKDSSEICMENVSFDEALYVYIKIKSLSIINSVTAPPKISNNSCYYICKLCNYKEICHYGDVME